jgi:replicative DNA helicase
MGELMDTGNPIEVNSLAVELERHEELNCIGGPAYLGTLLDDTVPESVGYHFSVRQYNRTL